MGVLWLAAGAVGTGILAWIFGSWWWSVPWAIAGVGMVMVLGSLDRISRRRWIAWRRDRLVVGRRSWCWRWSRSWPMDHLRRVAWTPWGRIHLHHRSGAVIELPWGHEGEPARQAADAIARRAGIPVEAAGPEMPDVGWGTVRRMADAVDPAPVLLAPRWHGGYPAMAAVWLGLAASLVLGRPGIPGLFMVVIALGLGGWLLWKGVAVAATAWTLTRTATRLEIVRRRPWSTDRRVLTVPAGATISVVIDPQASGPHVPRCLVITLPDGTAHHLAAGADPAELERAVTRWGGEPVAAPAASTAT